MPKTAPCLRTLKVYGEKTITTAYKLGIIDKELEIQRDNNHIYIPLTRNLQPDELEKFRENVPTLEVSTYIFPERRKQPKTIHEALEDKMPPHLLACLPRAIDFVGDIAIVEIPPELETYKTKIGNAILQTHRNVQTVLAKVGAVKGEYRLREFNIIAGQPKTETIHKEHGCLFYVDLAKVYFSPRLSHEHMRVASEVKEGETVIDMFTGVGPFAILIAKKHAKVRVYAIDINPEAIELLKRNVRLNRVDGKVYPLLGDAKQVVKQQLRSAADRLIMNLPEKAMEFIEAACEALKPEGGIIHFYSFVKGLNGLEDLKTQFIAEVEKCKRSVKKILFSRFIRETAPYEWQAVLDAEVR
ncbi:MAG: class I SAM-dependent methyltransferase family protein [Candidatus Bathyarchaeota archaeon]|nr:class I SAM-dependent methyltransferase family protein [Candidatus Bathyarchaeota archaeon]MDW8040072.1 class I SAM-dependent methyltransferase family protein [Nitrososphaerota archaeon]